MRSSCVARLPRPVATRQQSFRGLLQRDAAIREYTTILPSPVYHAQYGAKSARPDLTMLAANVGRRSNKAAETTIRILYGALDCGVPVDVVLRVPERLAALVRARAGVPHISLSMDDLHSMETEIQSTIDPLQVAFLRGDHSTQTKLALLENFKKMRGAIDRMIAWLENDLFGGPAQ